MRMLDKNVMAEKSYAKKVSIVIITHNRSSFVRQFVTSMKMLGFSGHLIVSESSEEIHLNKTKGILSGEEYPFRVTHVYAQKKIGDTISNSMNDCFKAGVEFIDTEYAMLSCDDDIPVPQTLDYFEKFLDSKSKYNGITGDYVWYDVDVAYRKKKDKNKIMSLFWDKSSARGRRSGQNPSFGLKGNTAAKRLDEYIHSLFHTMFVLVRANTLLSIIPDNANTITYPHFCADYNWMFSIAMAGKIKHKKLPYIIRQFHGKNLSIKDENHPFPKYSEAMLSEAWPDDSRKFINNIKNYLIEFDRLDEKEAAELALCAYKKITILRLQAEIGIAPKPLKSENKYTSNLRYKIPFSAQYKTYKNAVSIIQDQ